MSEAKNKPRHTDKVSLTNRLVKGSLRKNACKDRSGGAICGSVYETVVKDSRGKIVQRMCYPNRHPLPLKNRAAK